ncbi:DUF7344 domain-containing protein [Natronolimnohabitans innermongolicus]|uniref:DUF7344 domain-containing protein n=1 Tax=Natronolimnohabitans innermongolicus JCM 12255 TaxID=1227499 RepID=L9WV93_9EURY|nr:hypothetical protein [Natronolimnohabitans innermongolicus]ELY53096.1 hypothetical protein C493_15023 [Natronolimnohabitans innermongolicus JCM 12255]
MAPTRILVDVQRFTRLTGLSADVAHGLLGSTRIRVAVHVLSRCEPPIPVSRLARLAVAVDATASPRAARISLAHAALPKLEDYGVVEYELGAEQLRISGPIVDLEEPLGTIRNGDESIERLESREFRKS